MNLFILDTDPALAAHYHADKHVGKMILESTQFLCLAHWATGGTAPYHPKSQLNNPISKWVRASDLNYDWTIRHAYALVAEFETRRGKSHKTLDVIRWCDQHRPNLPQLGLLPFYQSVPGSLTDPDPVVAYRRYYRTVKRYLCQWAAGAPAWFLEESMTDTILQFATKILPDLRRDGTDLYPDERHRLSLEELPNGNARFQFFSCIASNWNPMGSIEIEVGQKYFWTRVVEVLKTYTGAEFALPDALLAGVAGGLPGAELLTQERVREKTALPKAKPRAGGENPGFTGTIKSRGKTKTRKGEDDVDILTDELGAATGGQ